MMQLLDLHGWDMTISGFEQYTERQTYTKQNNGKKQGTLLDMKGWKMILQRN